jgi:hypothetical protein
MSTSTRWTELATDLRARGLFFSLCIFLLANFAAQQSEPDRIHRLSSAGAADLVTAPALWMPEILSDHPLSIPSVRILLSFGVIALLLALHAAHSGRSRLAHGLFAAALLLFLYYYGLNVLEQEVYLHAFLLLSLVFLIFPRPVESTRLALCAIYWLAALQKLNPGWLSGRVFSSVPGGELPFLPDHPAVASAAACSLIFVELLFPFLLLRGKLRARLFAWWIFLAFHVYSIFILDHRFPLLMIGALLPLYPRESDPPFRAGRAQAPLLAFLLLVFAGSLAHLLVPGAKLITQEGRTAGLFMYDAYHACRVDLELVRGGETLNIQLARGYRKGIRLGARPGGEVRKALNQQGARLNGQDFPASAEGIYLWKGDTVFHPGLICGRTQRICCDPYVFFRYVEKLRERHAFDRVGLRLAVDLNGHDRWFTTVDENDFVPERLGYRPFGHNPWIRIPGEDYPPEYRWP